MSLPTTLPIDLTITGLIGGHNLDAIPTVSLEDLYVLEIVIGDPAKASQWQLTPMPPAVGTGVVEPLDYNPTTNNRRWVQVL